MSARRECDTFVVPEGWEIIEPWGEGWALRQRNGGLRVIVDWGEKPDGHVWQHVSVSRKSWTPSHEDMVLVKRAFIGNRYAYSVWPPEEVYVNIHAHCLHLWARVDEGDGRALPEFSDFLDGVRSI